jgi:methylated-DNA-[protein]-cysteine S-methyltransferase
MLGGAVDSDRHHHIIRTRLGGFVAEYNARGLCALKLAKGPRRSSVKNPPIWMKKFSRDLENFARGRKISFKIPLDLSSGAPFQRNVWRALRQIPRGKTRSYGEIAKKIGKPRASRAVGAACGANPVMIVIPCHRVVGSNGSLGGFRSGISLKKRLLNLEGALR